MSGSSASTPDVLVIRDREIVVDFLHHSIVLSEEFVWEFRTNELGYLLEAIWFVIGEAVAGSRRPLHLSEPFDCILTNS